MNALTELWDDAEYATVTVAKASQAAVLQVTDWSQRRAPRPARVMAPLGLRWLANHIEDPARSAARPYALLSQLVTLHREFAQRMLEIVEEPTKASQLSTTAGPRSEHGNVVHLDSARMRRATH